MGTRYSVRKQSGKCEAIKAEFNGNSKVSGDTIVCKEGSVVTVSGSVYSVGPRSASDSTACIFIQRPGIDGEAPTFREVWDEHDGWTPG